MATVLTGLAALEQTTASPAVKPFDSEQFKTILKQLRVLLEDDDAHATEVVNELLEMSGADSHRAMLKQRAKAVGEYNFDQALAELANLEAACKNSDVSLN